MLKVIHSHNQTRYLLDIVEQRFSWRVLLVVLDAKPISSKVLETVCSDIYENADRYPRP